MLPGMNEAVKILPNCDFPRLQHLSHSASHSWLFLLSGDVIELEVSNMVDRLECLFVKVKKDKIAGADMGGGERVFVLE